MAMRAASKASISSFHPSPANTTKDRPDRSHSLEYAAGSGPSDQLDGPSNPLHQGICSHELATARPSRMTWTKRASGKAACSRPARGQPVTWWTNIRRPCARMRRSKKPRRRCSSHGVRSVRRPSYDPREPQPPWVPPFEVAPPGSVAVPELGVAAVSASPWSISLFWPGKDRAVWSTYFDSSQPAARWVHPFPITPSRACMYGTRVVAVTPAQRSISLFWIGADRRVRSTYHDPQQSPDKGWADWFPLGQPWRGDLAIACVSSAEKSISLFFTVAGGAIQSAYYDASISTPAQQYGQAQALMTLAQQL